MILYIYIPDTLYELTFGLQILFFRVLQFFDKHPVELGEAVIFSVDEEIAVVFVVVGTLSRNQLISVKELFRHGRHPHERAVIRREKIELGSALEHKDSALDIFGKLFLLT